MVMAKSSVVVMAMAMIALNALSVVAITGEATFYTPPYVPSACFGFQDMGVMIAAASPALYANGAACGRRYSVTCTGGTNSVPMPCKTGTSVVVTIVDLCPGCTGTSLDLSQEAFAIIANPDAGRVKIEFNQV
ncbi:EG45-like domain containing protein [Canna indica]|uniref:EG45-like domain containing protein n=1 Tax=Canna indica TaxID=4628 RepID=A0AAQ3L1I7_9LILI|nr:EG45-like domain containing protein [Canna indica]